MIEAGTSVEGGYRVRRFVAIVVAMAAATLVAAAPAGAATNNIFTAAGTGTGGATGDTGPASGARLSVPTGVEVTGDGGYLIADQGNARVRRVAPDGTITTIAGTTPGFADGPVGSAKFSSAINGLAVLPDGSVLVADSNNNRVRKISGGNVTTVAGTGATAFNGNDIAATTANLNFPIDIAVRPDGSYLIAENDNHRVRLVGTDGKISTVAGTGVSGGSGDNGPATGAQLDGPAGLALTGDGFLVTEIDGHRVRRVAGGTITRVAGLGTNGSSGDGAAATGAQLDQPAGIALRADGGYIVSERGGHRLRAVSPGGTISRVAGTGAPGFNGDDRAATSAQLNQPAGVAVDAGGDYLIADALNHRIRRVDAGDAATPPPPDPPPPDPPPPGPPREHTVLGTIGYEPAFGVGARGLSALGPFGVRKAPGSVSVALVDGNGAEVARRTLSRVDAMADPSGPVAYRFDDLGPCGACSVVLTAGDSVEDVQPVSFGGEAGQTDVDLVYGRRSQGGAVEGKVLVPFGAHPAEMSVAVVGADGRVLADNSREETCGRDCPQSPSYDYRLTGLPLAATPVRAELRQTTGSGAGKPVVVDAVDLTLDPSGDTTAPDLTATPDPPNTAKRRTVFGQINLRRAFAPGARKPSDLDLSDSEAKDLRVELRAADGKVLRSERKFTMTPLGYNGYQLVDLSPCADCKIALVQGKRVVESVPVTIPEATPTLVRRDLNYARAGEPEFLGGAVLATSARAPGLRVVVTDAASGERLASTQEGDQACASGLRCLERGTLLYRVASVPPEREVVLTLERKGKPLDSRRVRTAPAGEVTQAPLLVVPNGKGPRSLEGVVLNGGPFPPGELPAPPKSVSLSARLLGPDGAQIATARAPVDDGRGPPVPFVLDALPECSGCTVELVRSDGTVEDRAAIDVRADLPSVTVADLRFGAISGGAYVQGEIKLRGTGSADDLVVQVLGADGKVLADSSRVRGGGGAGSGRGTQAYRLGGIPRDAGKVKVVVLDRKRRVASTTVTIAAAGDTQVPDLRVDIGRKR